MCLFFPDLSSTDTSAAPSWHCSSPSTSRRSIWACPMTQYVTVGLLQLLRPTALFFLFFLFLWYARVEKVIRLSLESNTQV